MYYRDRSTDWLVNLIVWGIGLVFMALIFGASLWFASYQCGTMARVMGFRSSWGPVQGCMIEHAPGKWVPIERFRVIEDDAQ